jgi:RNA-directed DNA polymerase
MLTRTPFINVRDPEKVPLADRARETWTENPGEGPQEVGPRNSTYEASNDRGGMCVGRRGEEQVSKKVPNAESGELQEHSELEKKLTEGLARIAAKARKDPKEKFNNLSHHITPERVSFCLGQMRRTTAPGTDGVTVEQAEEIQRWVLPHMMRAIHERNYEAPGIRRVMIPKATGGERPLGVPTVLDRALQAATAKVLQSIYEQDFLKCSFGFRPKLSCHHALATVGACVNKGMNHVLEVDIEDFFGSLSHKWMIEFVAHRISDKRILSLIKGWLRANVLTDGKWQVSEQGTPQGGSISPLLANIYLHYVLDLWFEKQIKRTLRGKAQLVRYCDDFVILFERQEDLAKVKTLLPIRLAQFSLRVSEKKSHISDLTPGAKGAGRHHISFLGLDLLQIRTRNKTSWVIAYQTEKKRLLRAFGKIKDRFRSLMHAPLEEQQESMNSYLGGYYAYFGIAGNSRRLWILRYFAERCWRQALSSRSQKGGLTWEQMRQILRRHPLLYPRLRIPYPALDSYVRL